MLQNEKNKKQVTLYFCILFFSNNKLIRQQSLKRKRETITIETKKKGSIW